MIESLKWGKLEEKIKTNRICMLYEIKNGLIDIDSHQYIQSNDSRIRGKDRLHQERTPLLVSPWMHMLLISLVCCSLLSCVE
jgi:hypothetical protein